jgi:hypothetical protein
MTVFGAKRILGKLLMPAKCYLPDYAMQQDLFDQRGGKINASSSSR